MDRGAAGPAPARQSTAMAQPAPDSPSPARPAVQPLPLVAVAGYLALFLLVDWASFIRPLQGLNITPWNPQPALAVALLLVSRRLWWLVLMALASAEIVVRGVPEQALTVVASAAALTLIYLAMAGAVERLLARAPGEGWHFADVRQGVAFLGVIAVGALASGLAYIGINTLDGQGPRGPWLEALGRYWIGDAVGMTVTLPILLVAGDAAGRSRLREVLTSPAAAPIGLALVLLLAQLGAESVLGFSLAYLLLLPVIAAAMRFGVAGAVLACGLTQVGLIAIIQAGPLPDRTVFELQLLLVAITTTALLLGIVVEQRARTEAELRRSLRLAAAGQATAALAHELSQPLNALALYADAARQQAGGGAEGQPLDAERQRRLLDTVNRMAADARRAGEVVRRLRDFFRSGSTQLERVQLPAVLAETATLLQRRAEAAGVTLQIPAADTPLPPVWADPVQLQLVLRNLIDNAVDAAAAAQPEGRWVRVQLEAAPRELRLAVHDGGGGLDARAALAVFEAGVTHKPGGMGLGLGISRAIIEAHGGRLWAVAGPQGLFRLTLPRDHEPESAPPAPDER
jgi:two-component system, LuxR family, sensor kinase FixL